MPKYSICATHYNNLEYIEDSAGILAETIKGKEDWEFIITDAGSDDGSLDYLTKLAREQDNVHVFVKNGANIGEGRQLAVSKASGDILIQVPDMDAEYYDDGRVFDIVDYYEDLIEDEGDVMLNVIGGYIVTKDLLKEIGGWNDIPVAEERGLGRRMLREGKLRFCDVKLFVANEGANKNLKDGVKRLYKNAVVKMGSGASIWWLFWTWFTETDTLKPKLGALAIFPVAWLDVNFRRDINLNTYDKHDKYILDFRNSVKEHNPEIWYEPPEELEVYAP